MAVYLTFTIQVVRGTNKETFAVTVSLKDMLDVINSLIAYSVTKTIKSLMTKSVWTTHGIFLSSQQSVIYA